MPGSAAGGQAAGPRAGRPLRAVSAVTFPVLAGVVVVSSLITGEVIRNQERLILREFKHSDWPDVLAYQSDPLYLRYNDWTDRTPEAVLEFVRAHP